jgi:predicted lipoprotein with Yx(FWY)xxD motif
MRLMALEPRERKTMKQMMTAALATAALILLAPIALAQTAEPAKFAPTAKGNALVDSKGMSLYAYRNDTTPGKSACNGQCATNWPPLFAADDAKTAGDYTVVVRDDGKKQWAYKGHPLYYWKDDKKAGDAEGDKRGGNWSLVATGATNVNYGP